MKILNIDELTQPKRKLVFKGKEHDVVELSVQSFIDNLKAIEALEASGADADAPLKLSSQVETSVKAIMDAVPTLNEEELRATKVEVITLILKFIRGEMDPDGESGDASGAEGGGEGEKKA